MTRALLRKTRSGTQHFGASLGVLVRHPLFLSLTVVGNSVIAAGAAALYGLEYGINPQVGTVLDAVWWSVATVTTVGYGDVHPITVPGKLAGIALMVAGSTLFWCFTALFSAVLIAPKVKELERERHGDEAQLERHFARIEESLAELRQLAPKQPRRGGAAGTETATVLAR